MVTATEPWTACGQFNSTALFPVLCFPLIQGKPDTPPPDAFLISLVATIASARSANAPNGSLPPLNTV